MITSLNNPKIKYIRRLQAEKRFRVREQAFVVEGTRWLTDLDRLSYPPQLILYTKSWQVNHHHILQQVPAPQQRIPDTLMAAISDVQSPQGVLAVVSMQPLPLPVKPSLLLILDQVMTPGNIGTMLRSAAAAGVEGVLLGPGCADVYNPKVIRAGMGAHLRLPIHHLSWSEIVAQVQLMQVWVATTDSQTTYTAVSWTQPSALIIGGEARGASTNAYQLANGRITIPMYAATESLNAAVAASVILFEAARQRSQEPTVRL